MPAKGPGVNRTVKIDGRLNGNGRMEGDAERRHKKRTGRSRARARAGFGETIVYGDAADAADADKIRDAAILSRMFCGGYKVLL